jgi:hypothetical protein
VARVLLVGAGIADLVLAAGYAMQMPWATSTWPWPDGRLSYLFVASILAAIGAAVIWIGLTADWGVMAAGALNLIVMMGGIAVFLFSLAAQPDRGHLLIFAVVCGVVAVANLPIFLWAHWLPATERTPTPRLILFSFGLFTVILFLVGGALILRTPNVMPWPLNLDTSVLIGWIFFGDAFYFLYALVRPRWQFARAQLWSFLAYDLVLIVPFIGHLSAVRPELLNSLLIYLVVLVYSGGLATYYLFIDRRTRVWQRTGRSDEITRPSAQSTE